jgi:hypothetical protein
MVRAGIGGEDAATALLLRPSELAFTSYGLIQLDTRRSRPDKDGARQREQHGTDKRAAMAKRGNANFDLARLQQLLKIVVHPFDRHRLTSRRATRGHNHAVVLHARTVFGRPVTVEIGCPASDSRRVRAAVLAGIAAIIARW